MNFLKWFCRGYMPSLLNRATRSGIGRYRHCLSDYHYSCTVILFVNTPLKIDKPVTIRFCGLKTTISWFEAVNQAYEFVMFFTTRRRLAVKTPDNKSQGWNRLLEKSKNRRSPRNIILVSYTGFTQNILFTLTQPLWDNLTRSYRNNPDIGIFDLYVIVGSSLSSCIRANTNQKSCRFNVCTSRVGSLTSLIK